MKQNRSLPALLLGHHEYMVQLKTPLWFQDRERNIEQNRQLSLLASFCSTLRYCAGCSQRNDVNSHTQPWTMHLIRPTCYPMCAGAKRHTVYRHKLFLDQISSLPQRGTHVMGGKNGFRTISCRAEPIDVLIMI